MNAIFSIILTVSFIGVLKAGITIGLDADMERYITMLSELKVVEVALWFLLAIVGRNVFISADQYSGAHDGSVSTQMIQNLDGSTNEIIVSRSAASPDFEVLRKQLKYTIVVFSIATISLIVFYTI